MGTSGVPSRGCNKCNFTLLNLPSEIIFAIADYIFFDDDLCYLVQACRFTFNLLNLELYKRSCGRDNFAILWAAKTGSTATLKQTLEAGGDSNVKAIGLTNLVRGISFHRRSQYPTFSLVQMCHSMPGKTPLVLAAENGHNNVVRLLLHDPKVMTSGSDAVHAAVLNGHAATVELLLSHDAFLSGPCEQQGTMLLHLAAGKGHGEVVSVLLSKCGVKVGAADPFGVTALHLAAKNGHRRTVKTLLRHDDTDANAKDGRGSTPLHDAIKAHQISIAMELMAHSRTDVNITNRHGLRPLHLIAGLHLQRWQTQRRKRLRFA